MPGLTELETEFAVLTATGVTLKFKLKREGTQTTITCTLLTPAGEHTVETSANEVETDGKELLAAAAHLKYLQTAKFA